MSLGMLPICRCCGKTVYDFFRSEGKSIHIKCIVKHWSKHAKGINNSRCKEYKNHCVYY